MTQATKNPPDRAEDGGHMMNEPDIGSGERTPAQKETDEQIRKIQPTAPGQKPADGGKS